MKAIGQRYEKLTFRVHGPMAAVQLRQHQAQARAGALGVFILDSMLIGGLKFVFDKIAAAADTELNDDTALREQLLAAQMRLELGELSQQEFDALEADVLQRLRDIRDRRQGAGAATLSPNDYRITGIEASVEAITTSRAVSPARSALPITCSSAARAGSGRPPAPLRSR